MQRLLRLCLWQALIISISCFSLPISAEEGGIRIRGPKSTDAFPYDRYGPITSKDTLWNIALKVRPDPRLSVYQVMQALYESNISAFKENNRNHMVNGEYLKIPAIEIMRAINSTNAQQKSRSDDQAWKKKVVKVVAKKVKLPEELSVKKKDLEAAKSEIGLQLKAIDSSQKERLSTIQNDVLDSIDGLQSLLKENESLHNRLSSFDDQLGAMQNDVAKGKEIKIQMDDMIALQQELLVKAEAREQALLLEKQRSDLEDQNFMSSTWFVVLMAILPASLLILLGAFLLRRRSGKEEKAKETPKTKKQTSKANVETETLEEEPEAESLDSELSLDEELSLEDELSLDDELSIDLSETDEEHDDLFSDDLDSIDEELLDDDMIQLDDDLDDISLDDISLDDDAETISLDDTTEELVADEPLEGGQLDQGDLDSLLAGLDTELVDDTEDEIDILEGGVVDQSALDSLLAEDDSEDDIPDAAMPSEDPADVSDPDDIDALLDAVSEEIDSGNDNVDISDPDDIDALLDAASEEIDNGNDNVDISDPDDIDALLDAASEEIDSGNVDISDPDDIDALLDAASEEIDSDNDNVDISDPDDIDALLNATVSDTPKIDDTPASENMEQEVSDPDDIDALLDSIVEDTPASDATLENNEDMAQDISDPDDIDALLNAIGTETSDSPEALSNDDMTQDVSDPDDIDALLDAIGAETPGDDMTQDVSDPDDIDALLDAIDTETSDDDSVAASDDDMTQDVSDPDDIDALLDAVGTDTSDDDSIAASHDDMTQDVSDPDDIDTLLDAIGNDTPEVNDNSVDNKSMMQEISDPDDIDALLNEMVGESSAVSNESEKEVTELDIDEKTAVDENENNKLIDSFSDEYVQSFIDTDFSDLVTDSEADSKEVKDENTRVIEPAADDISDDFDFDIDSLIDEVNQPDASEDDSSLDIGDDLLDVESLQEPVEAEKSEFIDDETLQELSADFDETMLTQLLNDEKDADSMVELSPDFTDSNVLADLLSDDNDSTKTTIPQDNTAEVEDIKELDNLDFDDLLANIEEETTPSNMDEFELSDNFDIGDDIEMAAADESITEVEEDNASNDFVSVDSLLSDSLLDGTPSEPYEKMNIDVGLGEFPEFSGNVTEDDIDDDDNGMAAKLDLAKVYIEIGDNENAEVILLDVVSQGDAQQQFDAQQLLDNL
jgi:pilus assembly protein FimV